MDLFDLIRVTEVCYTGVKSSPKEEGYDVY